MTVEIRLREANWYDLDGLQALVNWINGYPFNSAEFRIEITVKKLAPVKVPTK